MYIVCIYPILLFFFSSRRRHTRLQGDWSSDVCSSDLPAVQGVTLNLAAGDIGVLIGPSGCGKTTLLRAVAGLEPVSGGGIPLGRPPVGRAGFSPPPQQPRLGLGVPGYAPVPPLDPGRHV